MSSWWKDEKGEYKEWEYRCKDTGRDVVKCGYCIYPDPNNKKQLLGVDPKTGKEHKIILFNITDNVALLHGKKG